MSYDFIETSVVWGTVCFSFFWRIKFIRDYTGTLLFSLGYYLFVLYNLFR